MSAVARAVRSARRRLFAQALLDRLAAAWAAALAVVLAWFLAEPLLIDSPPDWLRWTVAGGTVLVATLAAVVLSVLRAPSRLAAALEVDSRFELRERVTTALGLTEPLRSTPSGQAVLADAEKHADGLAVREKFPVRPRRSAAWVPALAGLLAVVAFVYHPVTNSGAWAEARKRQDDTAGPRSTDAGKRPPPKPPDRKTGPKEDRPSKSPQVKELEAELDRLERDARPKDPDAAREKVTQITAAEDRARALEREKFEQLARLEQKLRELDTLTGTDDFKDGPARDLNDALAKGDLRKAEEAVEELAKKVKDPKLDPKQAGQLAKQLDRMQDELQRLARNQDQQDKLKDLIEQAKREGRDPESLQREFDRLRRESDQVKGLDRLAEKLDAAKNALRDGKGDEAARELAGVAGQLKDLRGEVEDLRDVQDQLRRLGELKADAAGHTGDQPGGAQPGGMQPGGVGVGGPQPGGMGPGVGANTDPARADNAGGGGVASGVRPDNPNAKTASADAKQRTPFDPKGRNTYTGPTTGPAFTKKSPTELGPVIERAVQEAPDAVANQPVTRDDKEAVREFFRPAERK